MRGWKLYSRDEAKAIADPVIAEAARLYFTTPEAIISKTRRKRPVALRHAVAYVLIHRHRMSQRMIGHLLGGRDSTTIMSSRIEAERRFAEDVMFRSLVEDLWPELKQRKAA